MGAIRCALALDRLARRGHIKAPSGPACFLLAICSRPAAALLGDWLVPGAHHAPVAESLAVRSVSSPGVVRMGLAALSIGFAAPCIVNLIPEIPPPRWRILQTTADNIVRHVLLGHRRVWESKEFREASIAHLDGCPAPRAKPPRGGPVLAPSVLCFSPAPTNLPRRG